MIFKYIRMLFTYIRMLFRYATTQRTGMFNLSFFRGTNELLVLEANLMLSWCCPIRPQEPGIWMSDWPRPSTKRVLSRWTDHHWYFQIEILFLASSSTCNVHSVQEQAATLKVSHSYDKNDQTIRLKTIPAWNQWKIFDVAMHTW